MLLGLATWAIALISAGGAIVGALVGGGISFAGIVYVTRRDERARKLEELVSALIGYTFAVDLLASNLEQTPPAASPPQWIEWLDKLIFGGEREQYVLERLLEEHLWPSAAEEIRAIRNRVYESGARLAVLAPAELLNLMGRMTAFLLEWQKQPGPAKLNDWGKLRIELRDLSRHIAGSDPLPWVGRPVDAAAALQAGD